MYNTAMSLTARLKEIFSYPTSTFREKQGPQPSLLPETSRCVDLGEVKPGDYSNAIILTENFLGDRQVVKLFCGRDEHGEPFIDVPQSRGFKKVPLPKYLREHPAAKDNLLVFGVKLPGYRETNLRCLFRIDPQRPNRCTVWEQPTCNGAMYDALVQAGHTDIANRNLPDGRARLLGILPTPREAYLEYGEAGISFMAYLMTGNPEFYNAVTQNQYMQKVQKFVCSPKTEVDDSWVARWQAATPESE